MYVFIPEHFYAVNSDEVRILARTCFCRGVRFLATQGQWTTVEVSFTVLARVVVRK